jgi:hypothetical protein
VSNVPVTRDANCGWKGSGAELGCSATVLVAAAALRQAALTIEAENLAETRETLEHKS